MLLHAKTKWPHAITANLWPYALRAANDASLLGINANETKSRLEIFAGNSAVAPRTKDYHTFGCPVYVLDNDLQSNKPIGQWRERARVGIYLGMSPKHARTVALVLNPKTGLVSPQFHVHFDDMFVGVSSATLTDDGRTVGSNVRCDIKTLMPESYADVGLEERAETAQRGEYESVSQEVNPAQTSEHGSEWITVTRKKRSKK